MDWLHTNFSLFQKTYMNVKFYILQDTNKIYAYKIPRIIKLVFFVASDPTYLGE